MLIPLTAIYAGLCGLIVTWLGSRVALMRRREKIGMGHGDNRRLNRWIRAHANAVENIPMILILLAILEMYKIPTWCIHAAGGTLVFCRLLHGFGLSVRNVSRSRFVGASLNYLLLFVLSVTVVVRFFVVF